MLLIINGTNRQDSKSLIISNYCREYITQNHPNIECKFLNLEDLNSMVIESSMYQESGQSSIISNIQDELIIPSRKWLIISPEYNGSFPGILKLFIDALSMRKYAQTFEGRYVGLIGVSSGRAGNARGMDHLTGFLNYLKTTIYHNKLPISQIESVIKEGQISQETQVVLNAYLDDFLKWPQI